MCGEKGTSEFRRRQGDIETWSWQDMDQDTGRTTIRIDESQEEEEERGEDRQVVRGRPSSSHSNRQLLAISDTPDDESIRPWGDIILDDENDIKTSRTARSASFPQSVTDFHVLHLQPCAAWQEHHTIVRRDGRFGTKSSCAILAHFFRQSYTP